MAQFYTLEEAATKLSLSVEEFKRRLREDDHFSRLKSFRDGATLRFRANEIDELSRSYGAGGSSDEIPLVMPEDTSDELSVLSFEDDSPLTPATPKSTPPTAHTPPPPMSAEESAILSDHEVFLEDFEETPAKPAKPGKMSDSDSDIRLELSEGPRKGDGHSSGLTEDEIILDIPPPPSGKLTRGGGPKSGINKPGSPPKSGIKPPAAKPPKDDSSEFELSLESDSSDEFELSLADSSDEISLGDMPPMPKSGGSPSGINLSKPMDSGVSLEKKKGSSKKLPRPNIPTQGKPPSSGKNLPKPPTARVTPASEDDIDFELSLMDNSEEASSMKLKKTDDSEFDLTLDVPGSFATDDDETASFAVEKAENDIFETDFDIPALEEDSASEVVAVDESDTDLDSSDFDLAIDDSDANIEEESASQVVALEEEDIVDEEETPRKKKKKKKSHDEDEDLVDEEDESASAALAGVSTEYDEDSVFIEEAAGVGGAPLPAGSQLVVAKQWGVWPTLMLLPCVCVLFVAGIMGYELLHGMWGYNQSTHTSTMVVDALADALEMKPKQ